MRLLILLVASVFNVCANDLFIERVVLPSSLPVSQVGDNTNATLETDEVNPGGIGGASVWYEWTCETSGWVMAHTADYEVTRRYSHLVTVFRGENLSELELLGFNNAAIFYNAYAEGMRENPLGTDFTVPSRLAFFAESGTTYQVAVHQRGNKPTGEFQLTIESIPAPEVIPRNVMVSATEVDVTHADASVDFTFKFEKVLGQSGLYAELRYVEVSSSRASNSTSGEDVNLPNQFIEVELNFARFSPAGPCHLTYFIAWDGSEGFSASIWSFEGNQESSTTFIIPNLTGPEVISIVNNGQEDTSPPDLVSFVVSSTELDLSGDTSATITAQIEVSDDLSGLDFARLELVRYQFHPIRRTGEVSGFVLEADRISGTSTSGSFEVDFNFDSFSPPGSYIWTVILVDKAGNLTHLTGSEALVEGIPSLEMVVDQRLKESLVSVVDSTPSIPIEITHISLPKDTDRGREFEVSFLGDPALANRFPNYFPRISYDLSFSDLPNLGSFTYSAGQDSRGESNEFIMTILVPQDEKKAFLQIRR